MKKFTLINLTLIAVIGITPVFIYPAHIIKDGIAITAQKKNTDQVVLFKVDITELLQTKPV